MIMLGDYIAGGPGGRRSPGGVKGQGPIRGVRGAKPPGH